MAEEKKKNLIEEFVEFVSRGNVIDLAVGVIIGGAFTSVVNSLVGDLIQPLIAAIGGNSEVKGMALVVNGQTMDFGAFISAIISFLITVAAVFAIVKAVNQAARLKDLAAEKAGLLKKEEEEAAPEPRTCPFCKQEIADDATRCPHCTSKLEGYANAAE